MSQLNRADLKGMSPEEIVMASRSGRLDVLLGRTPTTSQVLDGIERGQAQEEAAASAEPASAPPAEGQLNREDLNSMSPPEIVQARSEGRLNQVLGRPVPVPTEGQLSRTDLVGMSPAAIVQAKAEGRLNALLGRA